MKRGRDYRLNIALQATASRLAWDPFPGEREERGSKIRGVACRPVSNTHHDTARVVERQWKDVVEAQLDEKVHLPHEQLVFTKSMRRNMMDFELAMMMPGMLEDFAEREALAGNDARDNLPALTNEQLGLGTPLFDAKWIRVDDEVFLQYGPLADRRPA